MNTKSCRREEEALQLVLAGCWPDATPAELLEHVAGCASCGEIVEVATVIAADDAAATREASVPSSGLVWWRSERRARRDAFQKAATLSFALQAIPVIVGLAAVVALAIAMGWLPDVRLSTEMLASHWRLLLLVAIPLLTLAPAALYFAVHRD